MSYSVLWLYTGTNFVIAARVHGQIFLANMQAIYHRILKVWRTKNLRHNTGVLIIRKSLKVSKEKNDLKIIF